MQAVAAVGILIALYWRPLFKFAGACAGCAAAHCGREAGCLWSSQAHRGELGFQAEKCGSSWSLLLSSLDGLSAGAMADADCTCQVAPGASDAVEDLRKANARLEEENRKHAVEAINQQEEIAEWQRAYESLQTEGQELFQTYERKCTMLKQSHKELEEHKALTLAQGKDVAAGVASRNAAVQVLPIPSVQGARRVRRN